MESLLSLSFDYLSSFDGVKIRKGLKQLEGLLAQICLLRSTKSTPAERRRSVALNGAAEQPPKDLSSLKDDPAFREFFKLQEGFEWNVAIRLIACLERLLGKGSSMFSTLPLVGSSKAKRTQQTARTISSSCQHSTCCMAYSSYTHHRAHFSLGKST